jgi:hypothetical protein
MKVGRLRIRNAILATFICTMGVAAQNMPNGVITKQNLLSALEYGRLHRKERKSAKWYVAKIKAHKVDFQLSLHDERRVCYAGEYLGSKGLDALIEAIRQNRAPSEGHAMPDEKSKSQEPQRSISQSITNSPGSAAVIGDNNTVNLGPQNRRLTAVQESEFVKILQDNPKGEIEVSCIESGGPEPCTFAHQIANLMSSNGWKVNFGPIMFGAGDPTKRIPELYILVHSNENPPVRAMVLQHALKTVGYNAEGIARSDVAQDYVQLMVWHKQ